eukprot:11124843-Alexandrium_andersonii.AAC.1
MKQLREGGSQPRVEVPDSCLSVPRGGAGCGVHTGAAVTTATLRVRGRHARAEVAELRGAALVPELA